MYSYQRVVCIGDVVVAISDHGDGGVVFHWREVPHSGRLVGMERDEEEEEEEEGNPLLG